jgi:Asp/Glu/hydantoin racemase
MMLKTVYAIHTGPVLVDVIRSLTSELLPGVRVVNVVDDGLLAEVREAGQLTTAVYRRMIGYGMTAAGSGADAILNCCSSVGEAAELLQRMIDIPVVRIDDAMARQAVNLGPRIAIVATLATTLEPTKRLIARRAKESQREVKLMSYVVDGAFDKLLEGDGVKHDALVNEIIDRAMLENDVIVLAQGSMARLVMARKPGDKVPVLTSPRTGVESLRDHLQGKRA